MSIQQKVTKLLEKLATSGPEQVDAVVKASPEGGYIVGLSPEDGGGPAG